MNILRKSAATRVNDALDILPSKRTPHNNASAAGAIAHCAPNNANAKIETNANKAAAVNKARRSLARFVVVDASAFTN